MDAASGAGEALVPLPCELIVKYTVGEAKLEGDGRKAEGAAALLADAETLLHAEYERLKLLDAELRSLKDGEDDDELKLEGEGEADFFFTDPVGEKDGRAALDALGDTEALKAVDRHFPASQ